MILQRYLASHIHKGSAMVLLILVFLSLFFTMIRELDDIGNGDYGLAQMFQYLLLKIPAIVVEFMPLAVLLGCILSLGSLASGSEIIAMQSSGVSLKKLIVSVVLSVTVIAIVTLMIADWIVPYSETYAREIRSSSLDSRVSIRAREGVWIKDENNVIHIQRLFPDGNARGIKIYQLDDNDKLITSLVASQALTSEQGWWLQQVKLSMMAADGIRVYEHDRWLYPGQLGQDLLESLVTNPREMSISDLSGYIDFLRENELLHDAESLSLWRKLYSPLTIIVMGVLAIPFILGSQRQSNTGQRIMTGILLGLLYVVLNRLLIQLGEQVQLVAYINALLPTLVFMLLTAWLIKRKISNT